MATIPMDLIHSCILPRLPVKTLTRFKSVSKSWQTIISSREFIHLHHQHAVSSNDNRLFVYMDFDLKIFHLHELDSPLSPSLHLYNPELVPYAVTILASCEFFLLVDFYGTLGLVLLNPSTGRYYKIPHPPPYQSIYNHYGIYLDEDNNDYKVARIQKRCFPIFENIETKIEVTLYSLRTNNWRLIEQTVDKCYVWCSVTTIIGHLVHIIFDYYNTYAKRIGCFDILAEKWTTDVPMPEINVHESIKLGILDGLLCVTTLDNMWVMKEYGVKDSWFKLMSIASDDIWDWPNITPRGESRILISV